MESHSPLAGSVTQTGIPAHSFELFKSKLVWKGFKVNDSLYEICSLYHKHIKDMYLKVKRCSI
jgi:hypothetical protein